MKKIFFLLFLIVLFNYSCKKDETIIQKDEISLDTEEIINCKIVYELTNKRYDGGIIYYLLIDQINLENDEFKKSIINLIKKVIKEKGNKVSLSIYDNSDVLELDYIDTGIMTLNRPLTKEENNLISNHLIAQFSGNLETGIFFNTLFFFPAAFSDTNNVGKYVEIIEYNP